MTYLRPLFLSLSLILVPVYTYAQVGGSSSTDPRIRRALEQEGWDYEVVDDGDFEIVVGLEGRSQMVWVSSSTTEVMGLEVREIYTVVYFQEEESPVPDRIAQWALQNSENMNVGSLTSSGDGIIFFNIRIDANASPGILSNAIKGAAAVGDKFEQEKSTGDEL